MKELLTVLIDNGLKAAFPLLVVLIFQVAPLFRSNRLEAITLTARQTLIRRLIKIIGLSSLSALALTIIIYAMNREDLTPILFAFLATTFATYVIILTLLLPWLEKNSRTYFYFNDPVHGILFVQNQTVNNQIMLTSTPLLNYKTSEGFVIFVKPDYLLDKKIEFKSPKRSNWITQEHLDPNTLLTPPPPPVNPPQV
jgi:hypothetical protein